MTSPPSPLLACFCNNISEERVVDSILKGASNLDSLYESCGAGSGPCGGSCRSKLLSMLAQQTPSSLPPIYPSWIPPDAVTQGISLFNRRYYWEAHEVLEHLWLEVRGPEKLFYQAILQAAATFYHVLNANPRGVLKLSQDSLDKLQKFAPAFYTIPLLALIESLEDFKQQARDILGHAREGFDYDRLPKIQILESQIPAT